MKKGLKITLIVLGSLLGVILITAISFLIYFKVHFDKIKEEQNNADEPESVELVKIKEFAGIVYDELPSRVDKSFSLKYEFEGYEDFKIEYKSNNEAAISNKGVVTRSSSDVIVIFDYIITYKEVTNTFSKNITVLKTTGDDSMKTIIKIIREKVPFDIPNNSLLPTKIDEYNDVKIKWDLEVINQETKEIEPSIKIIENNGEYTIIFDKAQEEKICFITATITYKKAIYEQKFVIYTKTEL